jgi:hypothetical protein
MRGELSAQPVRGAAARFGEKEDPMRTLKQFSFISGLIFMFGLLLVPVARADEWNQATRLTFNQPMEIPGHKILAAGTYWFKTMTDLSAADDNVVQILNADRSRVIAVFPTAAIQRATPTASTEINFAEQGHQPNALVNWFYPGSTTGHEFLYSRQEEKVVASEPVLKVMAGRTAPAYGD